MHVFKVIAQLPYRVLCLQTHWSRQQSCQRVVSSFVTVKHRLRAKADHPQGSDHGAAHLATQVYASMCSAKAFSMNSCSHDEVHA